MYFELCSRGAFSICGYCTETSLETCGLDLHGLWSLFRHRKKELFDSFGAREDFYGLMWTTAKDRYCYLIGIEADDKKSLPAGTILKHIPPAEYAVARIPSAVDAVKAWTDYYYKTLPEAGYIPNSGHGFDFEYYPHGGEKDYELWTPAAKKA